MDPLGRGPSAEAFQNAHWPSVILVMIVGAVVLWLVHFVLRKVINRRAQDRIAEGNGMRAEEDLQP